MPDATRARLPSAASETLRPGTQLNGIYEIDRLLASGGMGEVYKGHAIRTGHRVAIKVIKHELADNELVMSLFVKEASSLYNLHHEAIVRYFIFEVDPTLGRAYLAMDFVDGEPLSEVLRPAPLPVASVVRLAVRVAGGLHAAHRQGITHRDISPDNIIVQNGDVGAAMIIDFGIARSTRAGNETIVDTGFAGKYNYVSPEQLGLFGGEVTPRSDIYSLGLVLLAALRGKPVDMAGNPAEVIAKRQKVPPLECIEPRLRPILARMLQPDPADRPASMLEVVRAFEAAADAPSHGITEPVAPPAATRRKAPPWKTAAIAAGLLALVGGAVGGYLVLAPPESKIPEVPDVRLEPPKPEQGPGARPDERPPQATAEPGPGLPERVTHFLSSFQGGPCFRINAVEMTDGTANIDGLGLAATPFDELDRAFKAAFGAEARIRAMLVRPAQCPVLGFLDRLGSDPALAPRVSLASSTLAAGRPLSGSVADARSRHVTLLLVSEDGTVTNVTRYLRKGETQSFDVPMAKPDLTGEPRLLLAVSSAEPLPALDKEKPGPAETYFAALATDPRVTKAGLGVALRYFQVE